MNRTLYYLGPRGSFSHQAAEAAARLLGRDGSSVGTEPLDEVPDILHAVETGMGWGIIAWENNVEGYVMPNLDALIDARDIVGFLRVGVDISFDAFVRDDSPDGETSAALSEVAAHPHGLAQCGRFIRRHGWQTRPAASNAAACRDLQPGQVALGPSICGTLYGLRTYQSHVQDYEAGRTEFLVLGRRRQADELLAPITGAYPGDIETIISFIPVNTGPGVLADLLDLVRDAGLNMTSFISRPIKGHGGTYSFIATVDAAPWQPRFTHALDAVLAHGDWVKTLAVYPRRERSSPPVDVRTLPHGGVRIEADRCANGDDMEIAMRRELLWR